MKKGCKFLQPFSLPDSILDIERIIY
jgi:hypothetical protein